MNTDKEKLKEMAAAIFELSDEEDDALHGFIPMTQEIFDSCMEKCKKAGTRMDGIARKLIRKYPEFQRKE